VNTGHVVEGAIPDGVNDALQIGADVYALKQFHFHAPSDDAAGGQVSSPAVSHLHDVISRFPAYSGYANNNRPLQALNGRVVELRRG
jgi:carbonic anhydrase